MKHGYFRYSLLILCIAFLGSALRTAQAASLRLSALVQSASVERHPGKIVLLELITPDLAAAEKFYGGLFGWTFENMQANGTKYGQATLNGRPVAGIIQKDMPAGAQLQPAWLTFISTRDVDQAVETAKQGRAKLLFGPKTFPDRGREAVLADPQGAVFGLLDSSSGDPPDVLANSGEWIWSSLITREPDEDAAFYQNLLGYDVFDASARHNFQHLILSSENYARASANVPAGKKNVPPHWINFVRIEDPEAMTDIVTSLGGKILVKPRPDRHGGKIAVVADPQGAVFGLMTWKDSDGEVPR